MSSHPGDAGLDVTVVVPTLGRLTLLRPCLDSLNRCQPAPREILVVDSSDGDEVALLVDSLAAAGARRLAVSRGGTAKAANAALRAASYDAVLFTHDDCVVPPDWVGTGARLMEMYPDSIITGSVLPNGDWRTVPGLARSTAPRDYTGTRGRVLVAHNMACSRQAVLDFGGFEERVRLVCEDADLEIRWLRAGRSLRYAPELKVWHTAWRSEDEVREVYRGYAHDEGVIYAKHLMAGDLVMLRYIASDLLGAIFAELKALLIRQRRPWDHRLERIPHLLIGLWRGFRTFGVHWR